MGCDHRHGCDTEVSGWGGKDEVHKHRYRDYCLTLWFLKGQFSFYFQIHFTVIFMIICTVPTQVSVVFGLFAFSLCCVVFSFFFTIKLKQYIV